MNIKLKYAKARKEFYSNMPRLKPLKKPVPCDGIKWGTVASKDIFDYGPLDENYRHTIPARGIQERSKCKRMAHWKFTALKISNADSGNYCWTHVVCQGLHGDGVEWNATDNWTKKHDALWVEICERLGIEPHRKASEKEST